jgi:hypothetical protein
MGLGRAITSKSQVTHEKLRSNDMDVDAPRQRGGIVVALLNGIRLGQ